MAKKEGYKISDMYQGGYSSLDPESYSPTGIYTGFKLPARQLGAPTKADTANQIAQVNMLLNQGIIPIEVGALNPDVFDAIPREHFKEINRMAKLAGADISVHAPLIEASGVTEQGWDESSRNLAERQLKDVIDRISPMNEKGGMSVTIHGSVRLPGIEYRVTPEGKKEIEKVYIVNTEDGKIMALKEEEKYLPTEVGAKEEISPISSPRDELEALNQTSWRNAISQLMHHKEDADSLIQQNTGLLTAKEIKEIQENRNFARALDPVKKQAYNQIVAASHFIQDAEQTLNGLFNKAYKYAQRSGNTEDLGKLKKAAENFTKDIAKDPKNVVLHSDAISNLALVLQDMRPKVYEEIEQFALDKSATTFGNVAFHAFKKYKDKAPTINIENVFPGMAFTPADDWKKLIKESRKKFVDMATKTVSEGGLGMSESGAQEKAEKIIGATLDVGHLNVARKKGYREKELLEEVKKISKDVKHVHLTDNFGYGDTHLPPGMGNVPMKKIMTELEEKGYKGTKIVEAPGWPQHFGTSPFPYTLEAFGSQIYKGGPTWNQTPGLLEGYSGGFGQMLPQVHYETFQAGFSQLPTELGGVRPGAKGSRLSGKPME